MTNDVVTPELLRRYEAALSDFWGMHTALAQIVTEDFPDGKTPKGITRYHLDALRDLTGRLGALVEGYDRA